MNLDLRWLFSPGQVDPWAQEMAAERLTAHMLWVQNHCTHEGPQSPYISTIDYDRLINNGRDTSALTRGMNND